MSNVLPDFRMAAAVIAARSASAASRRLGRGGGTALPGLVAERIDPGLIGKFTGKLDRGTVVVAGTNGKTTTSKMIADILEADGADVVHNRSGSNLVQGVAAACAERSSWLGSPGGNAGVIEADEAAFPEIVRRVAPDVILLTNLYRDQLDRYGELKTIMNLWRPALEALPATCTIVVNADDPALAGLTDGLSANVVSFGMSQLSQRLAQLPHAADSITCPVCGEPLTYAALYVSHLGEWRCESCGKTRSALTFTGRRLDLLGDRGLAMTVEESANGASNRIRVARVSTTRTTFLPRPRLRAPSASRKRVIAETLMGFQSAFGRIERLCYLDRTLTIALVKNPVGFNEVLRMLTESGELSAPALIVINDLDADGRDVSWLWDVDFELLAGAGPLIATAGLRGSDMANRLKYAGVDPDRIVPLGTDLPEALTSFVDRIPEGSSGWILPTYTAMLRTRKELVARGAAEDYWK